MAKVFVSYSRKDIEFAERLTTELQKCELDFWIDWEGIPPTVDWWKEIEKGIEEADIFIFLISPDSAQSKVCGQEIDAAVRNAKRIIPLVVRDIKSDEAPQQLSHLNWIFFRQSDGFDAAFNQLMTAIKTDYEWAATHRRLQVKALEWERNNKDIGFLLRGMDLLDGEQDLAVNTSKEPHPTDLQREFVFESRKATDRQKKTTTSIAIGGIVVLAALAVVAVVLALRAAEQAEVSRAGELAAYSIGLWDQDFQLSLLLGIESYHVRPTIQSKGALFANTQLHPQLQGFISGNTDKVTTVAFSPDGNTLASGNASGEIIFWDVPTRTAKIAHPPNQTYPVRSVTFSPDGANLAINGGGGTLLWNLVSNTAGSLYNINAGFTAFSLDGSLWVAGGSGSFVMQDLTRQGSLAKLFTHPDFLSETAALSPNGKTIAYFDGNNKIVFWDVSGKKTRAQQPIGQTISIDSLAFSPDGTLLAAAHSDGTISLWGTGISDSPSLLGTLSGHTASVKSVAFSPDGKILASGSADRTVILWDLSTKRQIGQPLIGHSDIVNCVSFSPNGKTLASGSDDTNIILWDVQFHQPSIQIWTGFSEPVDNIAFPPDSKAVAISGISGSIEYRDILNGSHISNASDKQANSPTTVMSNPDWTTLVSQDILDWNDIVGVTHTFDPGGEKLALGTCGKFDAYNSCTEGMIILWDVSTSKRVNPPITGHTSQITSLSFSPDAKTLASGGGDTIILWDLDIRQPIGLPIRVPPGTIDHLTFSPDGNILAASIQAYDYNKGSNIVTIILWDLNPVSWIQQSCLRAGRNFTPKEWAQYFPEELYPKTQNEATCPQWRLEPEETLQIPITK